MPNIPDWNNEFEEIAANLAGLVGDQEIAAREFLGNDVYEKAVAFIERNNQLTLLREEAQLNYVRVVTSLHAITAIGVATIIGLGIGWSLYFWFR